MYTSAAVARAIRAVKIGVCTTRGDPVNRFDPNGLADFSVPGYCGGGCVGAAAFFAAFFYNHPEIQRAGMLHELLHVSGLKDQDLANAMGIGEFESEKKASGMITDYLMNNCSRWMISEIMNVSWFERGFHNSGSERPFAMRAVDSGGLSMVWIVALLYSLGATEGLAQDASYKQESHDVYDEARVIESRKFARLSLLETFRNFSSVECMQRRLARLTVAPTQQELAKANNAGFSGDTLTSEGVARFTSLAPALLGQSVGSLNVAQVLCVGSNSTVMIRSGYKVERYQLSGTQDSRQWSVGDATITLVGFSLHGGGDEWISAFVRTNLRPDLNVAAAIRNDLEQRMGARTYLILRTDPFFWDMDGPKSDVFEVPAPRISPKEFLSRPYISCPPSSHREPCRLKTTH